AMKNCSLYRKTGANIPRTSCTPGWQLRQECHLSTHDPIPARVEPLPVIRAIGDKGYYISRDSCWTQRTPLIHLLRHARDLQRHRLAVGLLIDTIADSRELPKSAVFRDRLDLAEYSHRLKGRTVCPDASL